MKYLYNLLIFITVFPMFAQEEKPITTAFPFLLLSTDATASGMGDIGVCSSPDVFSQRWNAAKYVFAEATSGVGVGYAPYLNKLAKDVFLGNVTYYKRLRRSAWGGSFTYFTIGEVALTQNIGSNAYLAGNVRPSEFAADLSYNLKLSEQFAMGVATRYLQSALRLPSEGNTTARSIAFDISGYYTSREHPIGNAWGYYTWGFQLSNIGAKVKYEDLGKEYFIPTNLKIGASYNLLFSELHSISLLVEANKLLVPSVPE
ncbi:type IX secretion system outer membrane channel protein PorV, partial [Capnocytophaga genosp. AHN8471]